MSSKIHSILSACFVIVVLAVSIGAPAVAIASAHHAHHTYSRHHWRHFARRLPLVHGYANAPPGAFVGLGYVFVPGRGILDEACNLPTSACPNTERDTQ